MANPTSPLAKKVRQKQMLILGAVGVAVMGIAVLSAYSMSGNKPVEVKPVVTQTRSLIGATTDDVDREKWRERSANDMETMRQQVRSQQETMAALQKQLAEFSEAQKSGGAPEKPSSGMPPGVVPPPMAPPPPRGAKEERGSFAERMIPPDRTEKTVVNGGFPVGAAPGMVMPDGTINGQPAAAPSMGIGSLKFEKKPVVAPSSSDASNAGFTSGGFRVGPNGERIPNPAMVNGAGPGVLPNEKTYIPAGAFGRVVVLGGIDAPAGGQAQGNPHPVLLRFMGNVHLPGGAKVDLKDVHQLDEA